MKRILLTVTLLLLAQGAAMANEAVFRKEIDACYKAMARALASKNLKVVDGYLASNYMQMDVQGRRVGRAEALRDIKETMDSMQSLSATYRLQKVTPQGSEAVVQFHYRFAGTAKPDASGKARRVVAEVPMRAIWVKSGKSWKMRLAEELKGAVVTVDGKRQEPNRAR
jgi:hypothetical protein